MAKLDDKFDEKKFDALYEAFLKAKGPKERRALADLVMAVVFSGKAASA